ncbi:hypothetical protein PMIN05_012634 [Paraphaeosphaeria minitans]
MAPGRGRHDAPAPANPAAISPCTYSTSSGPMSMYSTSSSPVQSTSSIPMSMYSTSSSPVHSTSSSPMSLNTVQHLQYPYVHVQHLQRPYAQHFRPLCFRLPSAHVLAVSSVGPEA